MDEPHHASDGRDTARSGPGIGRVQVSDGHLSTLSAAYPLKLLSPARLPSTPADLATCYVLAYGGGLVAGDEISLSVKVDAGSALLLLTQGSTKVFKLRPGLRPKSYGPHAGTLTDGLSPTRQRLRIRQDDVTMLLLLPDPISPFRDSSYIQAQRFDVPGPSSSLLVLDWYTSGRKHGQGEEWDFARYESLNQVVVAGRTVMREKLVLDGPSIRRRMTPYHTYSTLIIYGDALMSLLKYLAAFALGTVQHQVSSAAPLLWSFSWIKSAGDSAGIVRAASKDVEELKRWYKVVLEKGGVRDIVGQALWDRILV